MKQVLKGTWVSEDILERRRQEFALAAKYDREERKAKRAAKKAAKVAAKAAKPKCKKWLGLF